jgi:hypothetical protein
MEQTTAVPEFTDAARQIRSLWAESEQRGAPMVSAESMQARLFAIYDEAARVPEALELVQHQLQLTLERTWYNLEEIEKLADQLDWLLGIAATEAALASAEADAGAVTGALDPTPEAGVQPEG